MKNKKDAIQFILIIIVLTLAFVFGFELVAQSALLIGG